MPLTDSAIRSAKPAEKPVRIFDGGRLYLKVSAEGRMLRRLKYRCDGKEKRLSSGAYPHVSLKAAREHRDEAGKILATSPCRYIVGLLSASWCVCHTPRMAPK